MKRRLVALVFGILLAVPALNARAGDFETKVAVSDAVLADLDMLESILTGAEEGAKTTASFRRLLNGILGEVEVALAQKITDDGYLTLSDGTTVAVMEGDSLRVKLPPKELVVIEECELKLGKDQVKIFTAACERVCAGKKDDFMDPPICNTVPPTGFKKKM